MYDELSGMSVNQWTVAARRPVARGTLDWSRVAPLKYQEPPAKHARPLVDMAIRAVAKNIGHMSKELLEQLPASMLWRLWRFLEARGGASLHAWKIFSDLLISDGQEDPVLGLYRFRQHVCRPDEALKLYTQPLNSASVEFIAHLTISGHCLFTGTELLVLADMKNLGVLELIQPADHIQASHPQVSDRIVRGWSDAADPFPVLRVLRIWVDQLLTDVSLRWVAKFPSLVLYDVVAAKADWRSVYEKAYATGWTVASIAKAVEDTSILRHLMLLAPEEAEDGAIDPSPGLCRSIDIDLTNLSSDSRCVLKRVPYAEAPPLLDYLVDPAKVSAKQPAAIHRRPRPVANEFCHDTAFETWAFWLYSLIGQLSGDRDLESRGVRPAQQTIAGPFVLPSKPMASLFLGHSGQGGIASRPSYNSRGLFATKRYTFTRPDLQYDLTPKTRATEQPAPLGIVSDPRPPPSMKSKKRRRMEDVLGSFG
ncbi:hypothetical protein A9K55_005053 [Cordyceps militaris]|uniref:Succinyl-3-ketoacid-coenzyme a transferase n=1 Tax=Cordyceps militaris TaxID=73501 RepID=A0A2H4SNM8_CORMI|nr:hypothetical protein A9K55_005053 [Cordyceps militaris]